MVSYKGLTFSVVCCAVFFADKNDRDYEYSHLLDVPPWDCSGFWGVIWIYLVYVFIPAFGAVVSGHEGA